MKWPSIEVVGEVRRERIEPGRSIAAPRAKRVGRTEAVAPTPEQPVDLALRDELLARHELAPSCDCERVVGYAGERGHVTAPISRRLQRRRNART